MCSINYIRRAGDLRAQEEAAEREARILSYSADVDAEYKRMGVKVNANQTIGPYERPLFCPDIEPDLVAHRDGPAPACCFFSPLHAANHLGTKRKNVLEAIRTGGTCFGRHFFIAKDAPIRRALMGNERKVTCPELDIDFESISDAARFAGVATSTMFYRLKDGRPCGEEGYTFQYIEDEQPGLLPSETDSPFSVFAAAT